MNRTIAYWIVTALFCLAFTGGGLMHLVRAEAISEALRPVALLCVGVASYLLRPAARWLAPAALAPSEQTS